MSSDDKQNENNQVDPKVYDPDQEIEIQHSQQYLDRDNPKVLGQFNFLTFKKDLFNIMFIPFSGSNAIIIARNLSKEDMEITLEEFNDTLYHLRSHLKKLKQSDEINKPDED